MSGEKGIVFKNFRAFPDGSGAPVSVDVYGDVYGFDFLGEVRSNGIKIRPAHGNRARGMRDSGPKKAKALYAKMIKQLGPEWLQKNLEMYPGGKGLKEDMNDLIEAASPGQGGFFRVKWFIQHDRPEKRAEMGSSYGPVKKGAVANFQEKFTSLKKATAYAQELVAGSEDDLSSYVTNVEVISYKQDPGDRHRYLMRFVKKWHRTRKEGEEKGSVDRTMGGEKNWRGPFYEAAPPGWSGSVKAMKKHMPPERAFALAWSMHKKGAEPHYKSTGSTKSKKEPELKKKYQEGLAGQLARVLDEGSKPDKGFEVGDIVRYTGKFLRNIGMRTGAPINGKIVGFVKMGEGRMFPKVLWSDRDEPIGVAPDNIEYDPKFKKKGLKRKPDYFESVDDISEDVYMGAKALPKDIARYKKMSKSAQKRERERILDEIDAWESGQKGTVGQPSAGQQYAGVMVQKRKELLALLKALDVAMGSVKEDVDLNARFEAVSLSVESMDDLFLDAIEEELLTEKGHHYYDGKDYYADTAFLNSIGDTMKGMELKHMGFGEFSMEGDGKSIEFDRMRGKSFKGQSGRSHKLYDNQKGALVKELIKQMEKKDKSELVKEAVELDEFREDDISIEPARYAKNMMLVKAPSSTGFKSRGDRLAGALGGKWTNRERGYVMSKAKAEKLRKLYADGWDAEFFGSTLVPPKKAEGLDEAQGSDALDLCKKVTEGLPQLRKKHFFCRFGSQYVTPQVIIEYADVPKGAKTAEIVHNPKQVKFVVEPFKKNGDADGDVTVEVHYSNQQNIGFSPKKGSVDEVAKHIIGFLKKHDAQRETQKLAASLAVQLDFALCEESVVEDWMDLSVFSDAGLVTEREDFVSVSTGSTGTTGGPPTAATGELTSSNQELRRELERSVDQTRKFVRAVYHIEEVATELVYAAQETERIRREVGVDRAMQRSPLGNATRSFEAEVNKLYGSFAEGRNAMMRVAKMAKISTRRTGKMQKPSMPTGEITATSLVRDVLQVTKKLSIAVNEAAELGSASIREAEKLLNQKSVIAGEKLQDRLSAYVQVYLDFRDQVSDGLFKMIAAVVRRMNEMTRRLMKMWESADHGLHIILPLWKSDPDFEQPWEDENIVISDEGVYPRSVDWLEAVAVSHL